MNEATSLDRLPIVRVVCSIALFFLIVSDRGMERIRSFYTRGAMLRPGHGATVVLADPDLTTTEESTVLRQDSFPTTATVQATTAGPSTSLATRTMPQPPSTATVSATMATILPNTTLPYVPTRTVWARAKTDRSGASIRAMLSQHALAFRNGWILGGICGKTSHKGDIEETLRFLGLDTILKYACPDKDDKNAFFLKGFHSNNSSNRALDDSNPEWRQYINRACPLPQASTEAVKQNDDSDAFRVAVHIRRGDVSLCSSNSWQRYAPNSHFLRTIDYALWNVTHPNIQVTIFTNPPDNRTKHRQYENLDVFRERGYTVDEGRSSVPMTWLQMMRSDVLITSRSTFPLVPAILKRGQGRVISTGFKHFMPLPDWDMVPIKFMYKMAEEMEALQKERCPKGGKKTDRANYVRKPDYFLGIDAYDNLGNP